MAKSLSKKDLNKTNDRLFTCVVCGKVSEIYDSTLFCSIKCETKYRETLLGDKMMCPKCGNMLEIDGWGGEPGKFGSDVWYYCSKCDKMFKNL